MMYKFTKDEFEIIKTAVADGLAATMTTQFEEVRVHVDKTTSEISEPGENTVEVADPQLTLQNHKTFYDASKLTHAMLEAGRILESKGAK